MVEFPQCQSCSFSLEDDEQDIPYIEGMVKTYNQTQNASTKNFVLRDLYMKANILETEFEYTRAEKFLSALLNLDKNNVFLLKKYTLSLIRSGRIFQAKDFLLKAQSMAEDKTEKVNMGMLLGSLFESLDQSDKALVFYRQAMKMDKNHVEACTRASKILNRKSFDLALDLLKTCYERTDENKSEVSFQIGRLYLEKNDLENGTKNFIKSYEEDKSDSKALAALAVIYSETEREELILPMFKKHLSQYPDDYLILSRTMDNLIGKSQFQEAIPYLEKMTDINPKELGLKFKLSFLYKETKKLNKAVETLNEIISLNGDLDKAYYFLADIYKDLDKTTEYVLYLEKVSPKSELFFDSTIELVNTLKDLAVSDRQPASESYEQKYLEIIEKRKNISEDLKFELNVSESLYWTKKKTAYKAIELLEEIKEHQKFDENHEYFLATLYDQVKKYQLADEMIKKIIEKNPLNAHAYNFIGYSLLVRENGDLKAAKGYIEKAMEILPKDGHIVDSYGWYFYRVEDYQSALKHLLRARDMKPDDSTINLHVGQVYEKLQEYQKAKLYYQKALALSEDSEFQKDVQNRLEVISSISVEEKTRIPASASLEN